MQPIKGPFGGRSRDQELLKSIDQEHMAAFDLQPFEIKHSRTSEGNDQAIFADQKPKA